MSTVAEPALQFDDPDAIGDLRLPRPYIPVDPSVKQDWYLRQDALEAFFGGAAGPGKSWALLMAALQYVDVEGYKALLLRPSITEFEQPGGLIEVAHDWLDTTPAFWNGSRREWAFPSGAKLRFGYLANEGDMSVYKGPSYSFCGFDELTSFTERLYRMMFRVLRQPREGPLTEVPLRMRSASNPGDKGHCVPYGEVLTPDGWRPIESLQIGDPVYAVDEEGALTESIVEQTHRYVADEIIEVNTRNLHMAVTGEHRVAKVGGTREDPGRRFSLVPFDQLPGQTTVLRQVAWHCHPLRSVTAERPPELRKTRTPQPDTLNPIQYARLLGWFLSEGYLVRRDRAIGIAQMKPRTREKLRAFLEDDCGFTVSWSKAGATIYAAGWYSHLLEAAPGGCREKAVPRSLLQAPPDVLEAFLDAAMDGDGTRSGTGGDYHTISRRLADDICEVAVKLGYTVYCSSRQREDRRGLSYTVSMTRRLSGGTEILTGQHVYDVETAAQRESDIVRRRGPVPVYCIGLPEHHAFVLRQRGSVWVSGNSWVKARFVSPKSRVDGAVYIPAKIGDNPFLDVEAYLQSLSHLSPVDRERLIKGDWDVMEEGGKFKRDDFNLVDANAADKAVAAVRYWDLAATEVSAGNPDPDWTVGLRLERTASGRFVIRHIVRGRWGDDEVEQRVRATAEADGRAVPQYIEQEPGASGKSLLGHYQRRVLSGYACYKGMPRGGDKEVRSRPVAAAVANGLVDLVVGNNVLELLDECAIFPNGAHDDIVDALSGAHTYLTKRPDSGGRRTSSPARARIPGVRSEPPPGTVRYGI